MNVYCWFVVFVFLLSDIIIVYTLRFSCEDNPIRFLHLFKFGLVFWVLSQWAGGNLHDYLLFQFNKKGYLHLQITFLHYICMCG